MQPPQRGQSSSVRFQTVQAARMRAFGSLCRWSGSGAAASAVIWFLQRLSRGQNRGRQSHGGRNMRAGNHHGAFAGLRARPALRPPPALTGQLRACGEAAPALRRLASPRRFPPRCPSRAPRSSRIAPPRGQSRMRCFRPPKRAAPRNAASAGPPSISHSSASLRFRVIRGSSKVPCKQTAVYWRKIKADEQNGAHTD